MIRSTRQAARRLLRAPAFALTALLTLTLGIGATTAVFSVVNGVLLRPLPFPQPHQLVALSHTLDVSGIARVDQSDATFLYYRRANHVFSGVGAYRESGANLGAMRGTGAADIGQPERVAAARVSASTFGVLGVPPLRGRVFRDDEDRPEAPPVVVISQRMWQRKYASDPNVVGRLVELDGVAHQVVGIMPASFRWPAANTQLWVPIGIDPGNTRSAAFDYRGVARLREGVSVERAAADLQQLLPRVPVAFPGRLTTAAIEQTHMRAVVRPLRDAVVGDVGRVLWVVLGAVAFVLLIACANVMNLFLVRAEGRQHEIAVRRALGATTAVVLGEFLSEGVLLAVIGGAVGLALAAAGVRLLSTRSMGIDIPRIDQVGIDGMVLLVATAVTVLAALLVSAFPALRSASLATSVVLSETGRATTAGRTRHRARHLLVVTQMALALMLLAGAGLMARSFARLRSVHTGFDAAHAFTFRVALPNASYPAPADPVRFIDRALDAITALPGVQAAGVASKLPLVPEARHDTAIFLEDRPLTPGTIPNVHQVIYTSSGYFRALGIPLLEGRTFEPAHPARVLHDVIVSRAFAERYWPGARGLGKRLRMSPTGTWYTVIGVAGDVHGTGLEEPPDQAVYMPLVTVPGDSASGITWTPREFALVARTAGDPETIASPIERAVHDLDPSVPLYAARPMTTIVSEAAARTTFTMLLLGISSALALLLGAVGIYGVVSYLVSLRGREIAVRLALGAEPADVRRMLSRQAVRLAATGILIGLLGAVALTRLMSALLFGVSPTDPATLLGASLLLLAVAVAASWLPARRAARTDPAMALRAD